MVEIRSVTGPKEAREVLDGVTLSDSNLAMHGRNARFHLGLSGKEHLDWLYYIKSALLTLGVMVSSTYPKVSTAYSKGKPYDYCSLQSYTSPVLTEQYARWYPDGIKVVPNDLEISPIVLANEFMGDGSSKWYQVNWVYCHLATYNFDPISVERLIHKLAEVGINHVCREKRDSGVGLTVGNIVDVHTLMKMVEPHMLPSYSYKIKRPKAGKPATGIYCKEELHA